MSVAIVRSSYVMTITKQGYVLALLIPKKGSE